METQSQSAKQQATYWNAEQVLGRLGGNKELMDELVEIFTEETPKSLDRLQQAISQGDLETVADIAHKLKGELGYFGLSEVCECARQLEETGRKHNLCEATRLCSDIETEMLEVLNSMTNAHGVGAESRLKAEVTVVH